MPRSYLDRWLCYLDDIDAGRLPPQRTYDCWCEQCWQAAQNGDENIAECELPATSVAQAREFVQQHRDHHPDFTLDNMQEFADLDARTTSVLRRNLIYRRHWIAAISDRDLERLPGVGPKLFKDIRQHIPFVGQPEHDHGDELLESCPTCRGTGLKLNELALRMIAENGPDYQYEKRVKARPAETPPSVEESLLRISSALERINSRLTSLERDRKQGLTTPRILLSVEEAARTVGMSPQYILAEINDGSLSTVRFTNGTQKIRTETLQEWLRWMETRAEPEPKPYVVPPELLCGRCGERQYHYRRGEIKLCRECQQQLKQERIQEKENKRAERQARRQTAGETSHVPTA